MEKLYYYDISGNGSVKAGNREHFHHEAHEGHEEDEYKKKLCWPQRGVPCTRVVTLVNAGYRQEAQKRILD